MRAWINLPVLTKDVMSKFPDKQKSACNKPRCMEQVGDDAKKDGPRKLE
jgi:hypothetical protein